MELRFGTELSTFKNDVDLNRPLNKADSEFRPWNTMTYRLSPLGNPLVLMWTYVPSTPSSQI